MNNKIRFFLAYELSRLNDEAVLGDTDVQEKYRSRNRNSHLDAHKYFSPKNTVCFR